MALREEPPHDVLAAEEFGVPAPDPTLAELEAHDVLAAEEFAMPAPDPTIHHPPVVLPADLTGATEPRDVLAAEEFAMPAPPEHPAGAVALRRAQWSGAGKAIAGMAAFAGARRLARRLRRR
ncbi:MAG TPA: hypothetical protein VG410_14205 [Solirubrobacteraceae bacterium]|jgi:hypothetical protein|nr:hypothetical protein [Solirubrobacteraceae bacterium]